MKKMKEMEKIIKHLANARHSSFQSWVLFLRIITPIKDCTDVISVQMKKQFLLINHHEVMLNGIWSPLALLQQMCGQIGADCSDSKPRISTFDCKKSSSANTTSSSERSITKSEHKFPETKLFKPYEMNVITSKSDSKPPSSHEDERKSSSRNSRRKSAFASPHAASTLNEKSASSGSPFKSPFSLSPLVGNGCNGCPTLQLYPTNSAFRSAFNGAAHLPPPSLLDPSCFQAAGASPYMSYTHVKTATGGETVVPVCKDPYCFSCRFTKYGAMGPCPPGCVQCDQKYTAAAMLMNPFSMAGPLSAIGCPGSSTAARGSANSKELLEHLRTYNSSTDRLAEINHLRYSNAVRPLGSAAAAARYYPYWKPGALPAPLGASPFSVFKF